MPTNLPNRSKTTDGVVVTTLAADLDAAAAFVPRLRLLMTISFAVLAAVLMMAIAV